MRELKPQILFVDDEELARKTFKRIADSEFRVLTAESVDEAIEVLNNEHDDIGVLLSDQRMPGRLGVDLLEHCHKNHPKIVRMLTTAYSDLDDAIAAVNRGEIMRYIEKPWGNIDGLLIDLRVAMSMFEMQQQNDLLVAEKLSMSFKWSRLEKIRMLIAVAGCQEFNNNLLAVESLLRQIMEIKPYTEMPNLDDLRDQQMFGQPLVDSITAIEIGQYLTENEQNQHALTWSDIVQNAKTSKLTLTGTETLDENVVGCLTKIITASETFFGEEAAIEVNIESAQIKIFAKDTQMAFIRDWLRGRYDVANPNTKLAALLYIYLLAFDAGGGVQMIVSGDADIEGLSLNLENNAPPTSSQPHSTPYDWIDDLLILSS